MIECSASRFRALMLHHEVHEGHEEFGNYYISISYFVLFAIFVVKCRLRFWVAAPPRYRLHSDTLVCKCQQGVCDEAL
jgi:hypothetical protein